MNRNYLFYLLIFSFGILFFSCKPSYDFETFKVLQSDWDVVNLDVRYKKVTTFSEEFAYPKSEKVIIRDRNGGIIYEGPSTSNIKIPDKDLDNIERLSVRVIAFFDNAQISSEKFFNASPKRYYMRHKIKYPHKTLYQGTFDVYFDVERRKFNSDSYENVKTHMSLPFILKVYIDENSPVSISSNKKNGTFNLKSDPNYPQFSRTLKTEIEKNNTADVKIEAKVDYNGREINFKTIKKTIRNRTDYEKRTDAITFGNQIGSQIMRKISPNTGNSLEVIVDHNNVNYDLGEMKYSIPLEVRWRAATWIFGSENQMIVRGILSVNDDGSEPEFNKKWENEAVTHATENNMLFRNTVLLFDDLNKSGIL